MRRFSQSVIGLGLVGLAALLLIVSGMLPDVSDGRARLAMAFGLLALVGLGLGLGLQREAGVTLRQILVWSSSVVVMAVLVTFHGDLRQALAGAVPALAVQAAASASSAGVDEPRTGTVSLRAESNGHFFAEALVDGTNVSFLVDTGATDVALAPEDAVRLGIDLAALTYDIPIITANGQTFAASTELKQIVIGQIRIENVTATIPRGGLSRSLLGMGFLRRLSSFQIDNDRLVMHQ